MCRNFTSKWKYLMFWKHDFFLIHVIYWGLTLEKIKSETLKTTHFKFISITKLTQVDYESHQ